MVRSSLHLRRNVLLPVILTSLVFDSFSKICSQWEWESGRNHFLGPPIKGVVFKDEEEEHDEWIIVSGKRLYKETIYHYVKN